MQIHHRALKMNMVGIMQLSPIRGRRQFSTPDRCKNHILPGCLAASDSAPTALPDARRAPSRRLRHHGHGRPRRAHWHSTAGRPAYSARPALWLASEAVRRRRKGRGAARIGNGELRTAGARQSANMALRLSVWPRVAGLRSAAPDSARALPGCVESRPGRAILYGQAVLNRL